MSDTTGLRERLRDTIRESHRSLVNTGRLAADVVTDAVLPVVEAETAQADRLREDRLAAYKALTDEGRAAMEVADCLADGIRAERQRADDFEDIAERHAQMAGGYLQRAEEAERQRDEALAAVDRARQAAKQLRAHIGPSHIVTPYVLRILHALDQPKETL